MRFILSIYAITTFVLLLLIYFPIAAIVSCAGNRTGGKIIYRICSWWADVWFFMVGIRSKIIRTEKPGKNIPYVIVANHCSYLDSVMIVKTIRQPLRILGKEEIVRVPLLGFFYRYITIAVNRNNHESRLRSLYKIKAMINEGVSVLIFPEGTWNNSQSPLKKFHDGAFWIAIQTQTPVLPVVFVDTKKRLKCNSIFSFTPGICRAVFLSAIEVKGLSIEDLPLLKEHVFSKMEAAVKTYC